MYRLDEPAGEYRIEINDRYRVAGREGRVAQTSVSRVVAPQRHARLAALPITDAGSDYEYNSEMSGSIGTMYAASLQHATLEEGAIDLKFSLKGDNGSRSWSSDSPTRAAGTRASKQSGRERG